MKSVFAALLLMSALSAATALPPEVATPAAAAAKPAAKPVAAELNAPTQLRTQTTMDRRQKATAVSSTQLKKVDQTASGVPGNIK